MRMLAFITAVFIMVFKLAGALVWPWFAVWVAFFLLAAPLALPWTIAGVFAAASVLVLCVCTFQEWAAARRYRKAGRP